MRKIILFISLLVCFICHAKAQSETFYVPDHAFRHHLKNRFPSFFNWNYELIVDSAKAYTGYINCSGLNINNLDGLQYFHNITSLSCVNNPLTAEFPSLDNFVALKSMWVEFCNLDTFPGVNHLTNLTALSLKGNDLVQAPDLNGLVNLMYLDLSMNDLEALPELNSLTSLTKIYAYSNEVTSLPQINQLANLQILDVQNNNLSGLPPLNGNTQLIKLFVNSNQLQSLPDLSANTSLIKLICHSNNLTFLPQLSQCWNLQHLQVNNNNLSSLPDLTNNYKLDYVRCENNALTFSDVVQFQSLPSFPTGFTIHPQDTAGSFDTVKRTLGDSLTLITSVDQTVNGLKYSWYRDQYYLGQSVVNSFYLSKTNLSDSGKYTCKITHYDNAFSGFELIVRVSDVSIIPCISATSLDYLITESTCEGISVEIDDSDISGLAPFHYTIFSSTNSDTISFTGKELQNLNPGIYSVEITDSLGCSFTINNYLHLPHPTGCGKTITPNGDGIEDELFIDKTGVARVYNKSGLLIKEINVPGIWDGTDRTGNSVPIGYYVIVVDGKEKIGIVVIN